MKKITISIVMGLLCLFFKASAQSHNPSKNLHTGNVAPDIPITNLINSKIKSARLSDYKGKLVILDFWSTWCSACIDGFPELDSLQRQFAGKLQVFLVNPKREGDSERGVKIVLNRLNTWSERPFKLPIVFQDTSITSHFVFHSLPHCVWIGPDGRIIGITDKKEVTAEHIQQILAGEPVKLITKTQ